jgi:parvulin-like peptidyl-prolyl isomerase
MSVQTSQTRSLDLATQLNNQTPPAHKVRRLDKHSQLHKLKPPKHLDQLRRLNLQQRLALRQEHKRLQKLDQVVRVRVRDCGQQAPETSTPATSLAI